MQVLPLNPYDTQNIVVNQSKSHLKGGEIELNTDEDDETPRNISPTKGQKSLQQYQKMEGSVGSLTNDPDDENDKDMVQSR